ncbi:ubiquitin carboxyl-terminal hydrolase 20-like [Uloborus diversus]|uniref:ubiquitin carboxyl-terminal hydrolase 20-like n=1 Tax=Uloborus diversus TaxID=327109 RepID=UPI0024098707|nr:ubiquitin carboxyl-terminal hydrolase 20-like [Uloborus diversus]
MTHKCHSTCSHIVIIGDYTKEDIIEKQQSPCDSCDNTGPNLWVCLHRDCLYVGCSDNVNYHSIKHYQKNSQHSLFLNLTTLRVYCLLCECEVFLENNDPPIPGMLPSHPLMNKSDTDSEDESESRGEGLKPKGLTGLQNLGNTCYMNSAIQALSNCPQLSNFFLECGAFVHFEKKPGLSKSFLRLMKEMWHKKRPSYVVPSGIAYGIKMVFPVFRGYTQQDAQEFLRCFMDQLHEELKEPVVEMIGMSSTPESQEELDSARGDSAIPISDDSSQSDGDYETCDSGLSSEMSSCADEITDPQEKTSEPPIIELADLSVSCSTQLSTKPAKVKASDSQSLINLDLGSGDSSLVETVLAANDDKNKDYNPDLSIPNTTRINENIGAGDCFVHNSEAIHHHNDNDSTSEIKPEIPLSWNEKHSAYPTNLPSSLSSVVKGTGSVQQVIQHKHVSTHSLFSSMFAARKRKPIQYRSIISDIFDGKILSSVQCLTCDTVSTTKETFQDLSLPIPNKDHLHMIHASQGSQQKTGVCTDVYSHQGWFSSFFSWMLSWFWGPSVSLQDCLSAFFSADELKGDNMYSCEKCKKLRNGIKYSKVIELPEILCIHLKRFRHEVMYSSKIGSYVSFPLEGLDMSPFLHKSYPRGVTTYDLASVICHHGTAGSGHYTTYSLNYLNEQWYEFDDQYVTAVDAEMVRHCEAYVLFYRKTGDEMVKKRQCAVELMERSRNEIKQIFGPNKRIISDLCNGICFGSLRFDSNKQLVRFTGGPTKRIPLYLEKIEAEFTLDCSI